MAIPRKAQRLWCFLSVSDNSSPESTARANPVGVQTMTEVRLHQRVMQYKRRNGSAKAFVCVCVCGVCTCVCVHVCGVCVCICGD